jgi:hypothetical protein
LKREIERILDHIDEYDVKVVADMTRNSRFLEEYRLRNCVLRVEDVDDSGCECWACERYGMAAYWDFHFHPDGAVSVTDWPGEKCWCWVCCMGRAEVVA